jgi:purine-binding chemotaxis protein CheW
MNPDPQDSRPLPKTDWAEVHQRLAEARARSEQAGLPSLEEQQKILKERALALAQPLPGEKGGEDALELVAFQLADERYGFESRHVREIIPLKDLTPLPTSPGFIAGIVNVRGQIFSVIDLKTLFELPKRGLIERQSVLLLQSEGMEFGVLADEILGVQRIPRGALQPALPTLTGLREEYLRGLTSERLALLDAGRLLADPRLVVQEEVQ